MKENRQLLIENIDNIRKYFFKEYSKDFENKTAEYLHMFNPKKMDPKVYLPEEGKKLWEYSERLWKEIDDKAFEVKFN